MTIREEPHKLVDDLPEQDLAEARLGREEALSSEVLAAIKEGLEDVKAGRTVSWEQIKREHGL